MCVCVCVGGISVAVPGEVAGYRDAWLRFGRLPWRRLVQPTIDMCRRGYRVQWSLSHAISKWEQAIRDIPSLRYANWNQLERRAVSYSKYQLSLTDPRDGTVL